MALGERKDTSVWTGLERSVAVAHETAPNAADELVELQLPLALQPEKGKGPGTMFRLSCFGGVGDRGQGVMGNWQGTGGGARATAYGSPPHKTALGAT